MPSCPRAFTTPLVIFVVCALAVSITVAQTLSMDIFSSPDSDCRGEAQETRTIASATVNINLPNSSTASVALSFGNSQFFVTIKPCFAPNASLTIECGSCFSISSPWACAHNNASQQQQQQQQNLFFLQCVGRSVTVQARLPPTDGNSCATTNITSSGALQEGVCVEAAPGQAFELVTGIAIENATAYTVELSVRTPVLTSSNVTNSCQLAALQIPVMFADGQFFTPCASVGDFALRFRINGALTTSVPAIPTDAVLVQAFRKGAMCSGVSGGAPYESRLLPAAQCANVRNMYMPYRSLYVESSNQQQQEQRYLQFLPSNGTNAGAVSEPVSVMCNSCFSYFLTAAGTDLSHLVVLFVRCGDGDDDTVTLEARYPLSSGPMPRCGSPLLDVDPLPINESHCARFPDGVLPSAINANSCWKLLERPSALRVVERSISVSGWSGPDCTTADWLWLLASVPIFNDHTACVLGLRFFVTPPSTTTTTTSAITTTTSLLPTTSATANSEDSKGSSSSSNSNGMSTSAIIGIAAGTAAFFLAVLLCVYWSASRKQPSSTTYKSTDSEQLVSLLFANDDDDGKSYYSPANGGQLPPRAVPIPNHLLRHSKVPRPLVSNIKLGASANVIVANNNSNANSDGDSEEDAVSSNPAAAPHGGTVYAKEDIMMTTATADPSLLPGAASPSSASSSAAAAPSTSSSSSPAAPFTPPADLAAHLRADALLRSKLPLLDGMVDGSLAVAETALADQPQRLASLPQQQQHPPLTINEIFALSLYSFDVSLLSTTAAAAQGENFFLFFNRFLRMRPDQQISSGLGAALMPYLFYFRAAFEKIVPNYGNVYRGISLTDQKDWHSVKTEYVVGRTVVWSGVSSVSADEAVAQQFERVSGATFSVSFRISAVDVRSIAPFSCLPAEDELLMQPRSTLVVLPPPPNFNQANPGNCHTVFLQQILSDRKSVEF